MPFGALIAGLGKLGAGAVSGVGSAIGSLGTQAGWLGTTGSTQAGLMGTGGTFNPAQALSTMGMGMGLMQAFSGGAATGYAPTTLINMTAAGKKLEKTLFETAKKQYEGGLLPPNLASIYIGGIKREEGKRAKATRGMLAGAATRDVGTGRDIEAILGESGARMEGLTAPARWRAEMSEEEFRNALKNLSNIMAIEKQAPILQAQSQLAKSGFRQMQRATQGAALGDVAQYLALLRYNPYAMG